MWSPAYQLLDWSPATHMFSKMEVDISQNKISSEDGEDEAVKSPADVKREKKLGKLLKNSDSKRGIVYLSRIPTGMNVKLVREKFELLGKTDRIFLQPDEKQPSRKKCRVFTEGWVEFKSKRVAKRVAQSLNNTQVGGKKKQLWYWDLWNIKYLPKFKWGHLNERLAYEKAVHQQRLRTEIAQVKRESNFYIQNVERNEKRKRQVKKKLENENEREWDYNQTAPREESGKVKEDKVSDKSILSNKSLLKTIFSGGRDSDDDEL